MRIHFEIELNVHNLSAVKEVILICYSLVPSGSANEIVKNILKETSIDFKTMLDEIVEDYRDSDWEALTTWLREIKRNAV
jgi:hypothetical protein